MVTRAGETEILPHWGATDEGREEFRRACEKLGLSGADVVRAINCARVTAYEGTLEQAVEDLRDYAHERLVRALDGLQPQRPEHHEAQAIAWTEVYTPTGQRINVTARHGATPDDVVSTALALSQAVEMLERLGFRATRR